MAREISQLIQELHPLERKVLAALQERPTWTDDELAAGTGLDESRLSMALGWLLTKEIVVTVERGLTETFVLTERGQRYANELPEERILGALQAGEVVTVNSLRERSGLEPLEVSKAVGNLKQAGIVRIGEGGRLEWTRGGFPSYVLIFKKFLGHLKNHDGPLDRSPDWFNSEYDHLLRDVLGKKWKVHGELFHRREKKRKNISLTPLGQELVQAMPSGEAMGDELAQLTPELLKDGTWRGKRFRKYYIELKPPRMTAGRKHPYRQFLDDVNTKLVSMGFEEMRGPMVESEFWNMDALFMPQFHPARDIHDVYFVKDHAPVDDIDPGLLERVAVTHEHGGRSGSLGWRYRFDRPRARQPILRSQGTAVSSRMLANQPRIPGKYFSIARCFRYDQVDATHAPDFFQVEGIVLDPSITFRTLLGLLKLFATELAKADDIKFLPAYFPFTEPSVELHVRHPKLGWMELGGAGLFRPEVTAPMELTVPVIAWGLGLDRMAMMAMGLHDIRDLFSSDLQFLRELPAPATP